MENNQVDLHKFLNKGALIIFNISVIIICLGYILDIIAYQSLSKRLLLLNSITLIIIAVVFALFRLKIINLKVGYTVIIYAVIANIFTETFTDAYLPDRIHFLMRDSLFIIIAFTLASLVINKMHSIIIAGLYLLAITAFTLLTGNEFLLSSIYLIYVIISSYAVVVYYFVTVIEKSIATVELDSQTIKEQNRVVNESYSLLLDHQKKIEKQSEELIQQSKILHEQSELLQDQNDELSKLVATKDKFFSVLAHDLKNPFNTILGFTELLDLKYDKLDEAKKKKYIDHIRITATKTYSLLENLLLWARSQSGRLEYNPERISAQQILDSCLKVFEQAIQDKQLEIIKTIDEDSIIYVDIDQMEIVFRNLISNAIKYSRPGGVITIDYVCRDSEIEISFKDKGVGIEEEEIKNLFRIEKGRKTPGTSGEVGTGLGLVICSEMVKLHKGRLIVKSKISEGSTFSLILPNKI